MQLGRDARALETIECRDHLVQPVKTRSELRDHVRLPQSRCEHSILELSAVLLSIGRLDRVVKLFNQAVTPAEQMMSKALA